MMARSAGVHDVMIVDLASSMSIVNGCTRENPEMRYVAMDSAVCQPYADKRLWIPRIHCNEMSMKALNYVARNTIGSFLTSSPDPDTNEYKVISMACDYAVDRLKEEKIRGQNLLHSLPQLSAIIHDVSKLMQEEGEKNDLNDAPECWNVFAMIIVHTALANFYKKSQQKKMD